MGSENIKVATSQKDWDDFFAAEEVSEDSFNTVDAYAERVCVACQFGGWEVQEANKRLDELKKKKSIPPSLFEFDR